MWNVSKYAENFRALPASFLAFPNSLFEPDGCKNYLRVKSKVIK